MIKVEELEKQLNQNQLSELYLLYGKEKFLLDQQVRKMKKLFGELVKGINYVLIDDTNINELIANIETPAFGYEKKLIIARNTNILKKEGKRKNTEIVKIREKLEEYIKENIDIIKESVVLVFIEEDVDTRFGLYKTFDKYGITCKVDFQKPIQLEKRIIAICNGYKVKIDNVTTKYFIETCGTNMQELINEIRKLIEYAGENGTIKKEDIDLLTTKKLENVIFDLTDNLGKKETKRALEVLQNLIYNKEPIQKIFITLYGHFKKLYITKIAINEKINIAESLNLKPNQTFLVNKYTMQSKYFKEAELRKLLQEFIDLDYKSKSGAIDLNVGLEAVLCRYCS